MVERSHAELEQYHNKALSNPHYRMEGLLDCEREYQSMFLPSGQYQREPEHPVVPPAIPYDQEIRRMAYELTQLKAANLHLQNQLGEHLKNSKRASRGKY